MGKIEYSGKLISYLPPNFPRLPNEGRMAVYEAVLKLNKDKELSIPINIRKLTGLGKTATQVHLNKLVKSGHVDAKYAKVQLEHNTVVCAIYSPTKKKI